MTHTTQTLVDDGPFEIICSYSFKWVTEPEDVDPELQTRARYTEIDSLEVVIKGEGFDIFEAINKLPNARRDRVMSAIINELNYE